MRPSQHPPSPGHQAHPQHHISHPRHNTSLAIKYICQTIFWFIKVCLSVWIDGRLYPCRTAFFFSRGGICLVFAAVAIPTPTPSTLNTSTAQTSQPNPNASSADKYVELCVGLGRCAMFYYDILSGTLGRGSTGMVQEPHRSLLLVSYHDTSTRGSPPPRPTGRVGRSRSPMVVNH